MTTSGLIDIFERMKTAGTIPDTKADGNTLRRFFREFAPDHDEEKVYASDMKKVITWYQLLKDMPLFNEPDPAAAPEPDQQVIEEAEKTEPVVAEKEAITDVAASPKPKSKQQKSPVKK